MIKKTVLLLALLSTAVFCQAIPSSEAQEKAGDYFVSGEKDVVSLSKPIETGADSYWAFFYSIYSTKKNLVAVSDSLGQVIKDEKKLSAVGEAVYDYNVIEEYLKKNGWSFPLLDASIEGGKKVINENQRKLSDFSNTMSARYPQLSFDEIGERLNKLNDAASEIKISLNDGKTIESQFANYYDSSTLRQLTTQYSQSLKLLEKFFAECEEYDKAISDTESDVYNANITDPDFTSINKNLEALRDLGVNELKTKYSREEPSKEFNRLLSQKTIWVNDSIASFLYKEKTLEAREAVEKNRISVEEILGSQKYYYCTGEERLNQLRRDWNNAKYFLSKNAFDKVLELTPSIEANVSEIKSKCIAPTPQPTGEGDVTKEETNWTPIISVIALAVILYVIYSNWKKNKEQEEQGEKEYY